MYDSRQLSILIPETRRLMTLPVVALQAHVQLPELRIQIMYGNSNKDYVHTQKPLVELQQKGAVSLAPMPDKAFHASRLFPVAHSQMLMPPAAGHPEGFAGADGLMDLPWGPRAFERLPSV